MAGGQAAGQAVAGKEAAEVWVRARPTRPSMLRTVDVILSAVHSHRRVFALFHFSSFKLGGNSCNIK